jgi:hypothetical protein
VVLQEVLKQDGRHPVPHVLVLGRAVLADHLPDRIGVIEYGLAHDDEGLPPDVVVVVRNECPGEGEVVHGAVPGLDTIAHEPESAEPV